MPPVEERADKMMLPAAWPDPAIKMWTEPAAEHSWPPVVDADHPAAGAWPQEPADDCRQQEYETLTGLISLTASSLKTGECEPRQPRSVITNVDYFFNRSLSHLIKHCLGCPEDGVAQPTLGALPLLHSHCASYTPSIDTIQALIEEGCDLNQISHQGRAPLHTLLRAEHAPSVDLVSLVSVLVEAGARLDLTDDAGNTPLNCVEELLVADRMDEAARVSRLFLSSAAADQHACDVNHINFNDRSLLSVSVSYLDRTAELTRLLVNHGGRVWPRPAPPAPVTVDALRLDREQSAFTWFLRAVIQASNLDGAENTLACLSHEMGRDPARMRSHVTRVLLSEGKHPRVLRPLYNQLVNVMRQFWSEPQQLRYLAWKSIRKSIGPKRLTKGSQQLGLPSPLRKYLTLSTSRSSTRD